MSPQPTLDDFDLIVANLSGGKDSTAMLIALMDAVDAQGFNPARVVCFHAALGVAEWPGTLELARDHAQSYGLRFEARSRTQNNLLEHIESRGKFPSSAARYCTSDHKRGPGRRLLTELVKELGLDRPAKILDVMGFRAEESSERARRTVFAPLPEASNKHRRHVWRWLPIHDFNVTDVWKTIHSSGLPWHWAYDAGMSRLSCSFCVLASKPDLITAARLRPDLAEEYAQLEERIDHRFTHSTSMRELIHMASQPACQPALKETA
jgi:3'-phosphoadenosine 5'-phosphosulfate sulfotransferase (PAPS reductase)/FAD synthetase